MARVLAAGTFDSAFNRNQRILDLLARAGHEVATCHVDLWPRERYAVPKQGKVGMLVRAATAYPRLVWRFVRARRADVVLVLEPGWFDMLVLGPLARLRRMPVWFEPFVSLSDTVVADRKLVSSRSVVARVCRFVDRRSLREARRVIADTPVHADFYAQLARIPRDHIGVVWVGARDDVFIPQPDARRRDRRVLFYGTFINLHGIDVIVRAAKLLEPDGIEVRIIGTGQEESSIDGLLKELEPANVTRVSTVPLEVLATEIGEATVCLGIFGVSDKAGRVVPNKVFECAAVGRPIITADTAGMRSAFDETQVAMVPAGDPTALAAEIRRLLADADTREKLAAAAHERYLEQYATDSIIRLLDSELQQVLGPRH